MLAKLSSSPNRELAARAQELGALWGDAAAMRAALKLADDPRANPDERVKAIQVVRQLKNDETRDAMLQLVVGALQIIGDGTVATAAMRAGDAAYSLWRIAGCRNGALGFLRVLHERKQQRLCARVHAALDHHHVVPWRTHDRLGRRA